MPVPALPVPALPVPAVPELRARCDEILGLAAARGAHRVRVFGSVARGDSTSTSDVDFLGQLDDQRKLFDLGGLLMDLQELLGCDVDVTTEVGLRPRVAERVLSDAVEL
jgi:predicted nucleotidyltransferase